MNARRRTPSRERVRSSTLIAEISVLLSTAIAVLSFTNVDRQLIVALAIPAVLLIAAFFLISRRLYSVTVVNTTIALAGPPGVGKTVYINVLCNQLLEGSSHVLSFVPETQTVQHIYRTVGNIRDGRWPRQTSTDHIDRYKGTIGFNRIPLIRVMLNGRLEFEVEFGDAAGENWDELAKEAESRVIQPESQNGSSLRLIESNFFTYVGESDCLMYFIDASDFPKIPSRVAECVDDLLSTLQLLRAVDGVRPGMALQRPIAIILSKVDALPSEYLDQLAKVISQFDKGDVPDEESFGIDEIIPFFQSIEHLQRLVSVLSKQSRSYRLFLVSALAEATSGRTKNVIKGTSLRNWSEFRTQAPLEWMFQELWRLRRFRAATRTG